MKAKSISASLPSLLLFTVCFAIPAGIANAAEYYLGTTGENAGGSSFTNPLTPSAAGWKLDNSGEVTAPAALNNYTVGGPNVGGNPVGTLLRSPVSGSVAFPGDKLIISSGRFIGKSNNNTGGVGTTVTINNLVLNGGLLDQAGANAAAPNGAIFTVAGNINVTATSSLGALPNETLSITSTITGSSNLVIDGTVNGNADTGFVDFSGTSSAYTGSITITPNNVGAVPTLQIGNNGTTGSFSSSTNIIDNGALGINRTNTVTQGTDFGLITGAGTVTQTGTGNVILNAANTFTGQVSIFTGGSITASTINSVGAGAMASSNLGAPTTVANGTIIMGGNGAAGKLIYVGTGETTDRAIRLNAFSTGSNGVIDQSGTGLLNFTGGITNGAGSPHVIILQGSTAGTGEISGVIAPLNAGSVIGLTKAGTGIWTVSGANIYLGATTVNAGTLKAGVASVANTSGAFGNNSAVTMANIAGATLDITGFDTQIGSLTGGGDTGGNITLGGATLTSGGNNSSPMAYAGVISGMGGALTKIGTGTMTLSGTNTYTGATTISAGILQVGNNGATGSLATTSNIVTNAEIRFGRVDTITQGTDFGLISGTGNVTQTGSGNLILNAANTFTGGVSIYTGGSITASTINSVVGGTTSSNLGAPTTTANGTITMGGNSASGTLIYIGTGETTDRAIRLNAFSIGSNGVIDQSGTGLLKFTGGITNTSGSKHVITFKGSTAGTGEISGAITNGIGLAVIKDGTGTWTLSGANTYTGDTTIYDGMLILKSPSLADASSVYVYGSSTLKLDYTGTDLVTALYINGNFVPDGIYGSDDPSGQLAGTGKIKVLANGYASWATTNAGGQGAQLDFDNDGVKNGVEFFMGETGSTFTTTPSIVGNTLTFPKSANYTGTYHFQTSPDLVVWTDATTGVTDTGTSVSFVVPDPVVPGKQFVRLKVEPE